jgi:hypothetical protein
MRTTLLALSVSAALGLIYCQSSAAMPAAPLQQAEAAASPVQPAQCDCTTMCCPNGYVEHRTKHYIVKCYRDFGVGPYRCHRYRYR